MTTQYVPDTGHIVWLHFPPQAGHEQSGHRPALVLSPSTYNEKTDLGTFCPITSRIKGYPFEVQIPDSQITNGVILADQVRSLDWRVRNAQYVEQVSQRVIAEVISKFSLLLTPKILDWTIDASKMLDELLTTAEDFLSGFELVFDYDWEMTKNCIENSEYFISGTFVRPNVEDESNNWANRGSLLEDYRELRNCVSRIRQSVNIS